MPPRRTPIDRVFQTVGQRIRQIRLSAGMTQEALAAAASMQAETISRIETAAVHADVATLVRVATALGVELVDVVDKDQEMPRPTLAKQEVDLLLAYRRLDVDERDVVDRLLKMLKRRGKQGTKTR